MAITYTRVWINRVRLSILLVVSLTEKKYFSLSPFMPESLVSRRVCPSRPASACPFSTLRLNLVLTRGILPNIRGSFSSFIPPYTIVSVPSLSGHAIAYRRRSLPRAHRHRASSPQDSFSSGCCLCRSPSTYYCGPLFFHIHYWNEVGMMNVLEATTNSVLCELFGSCSVVDIINSTSAPYTAPLYCVRPINAGTSDQEVCQVILIELRRDYPIMSSVR